MSNRLARADTAVVARGRRPSFTEKGRCSTRQNVEKSGMLDLAGGAVDYVQVRSCWLLRC
jgi:hypothetical protein